jgi:hypothetical protein
MKVGESLALAGFTPPLNGRRRILHGRLWAHCAMVLELMRGNRDTTRCHCRAVHGARVPDGARGATGRIPPRRTPIHPVAPRPPRRQRPPNPGLPRRAPACLVAPRPAPSRPGFPCPGRVASCTALGATQLVDHQSPNAFRLMTSAWFFNTGIEGMYRRGQVSHVFDGIPEHRMCHVDTWSMIRTRTV